MKITFHGAAREVTGSKHLLELQDGTKVLLDCGLFQGNPKEADLLNKQFGFKAEEIDYLIVSHAHIDHCGLIPRLVAQGFKGKAWCTPPTLDLAKILMLDSAHIQEQDMKYINKKNRAKGLPEFEALYTSEDVQKALTLFQTVPYNQTVKIKDGLEFIYTDAGHIMGSAAVSLKVTEGGKDTHITFSGDVGRYNDEILFPPQTFPQADYVLLESTYGDSLHQDTQLTGARLLDAITKTCLQKKGNLIIPAFSVGRTQELIYLLNRLEVEKKLPNLDFFVDSPLSVEATAVVKAHSECFNNQLREYMKTDPEPFNFKGLHYITEVEDSKKLNDRKEPCVIISASGMADAGRVKHHIKNNISDAKNTILIVGHCEPRSLGGQLMNGAKHVTIFGEPFDVHAEVQAIKSLSSHGDYDDLIHFISCQDVKKVKKVFLVHGDYEVQQTFRTKLIPKGFSNVEIPALHETVELND
jgi:metallo-beta-lactamase family protein